MKEKTKKQLEALKKKKTFKNNNHKDTNQQNCIFVQIHFSNDYKQQQNVRKTYSFSNIKTLLDILRMQDFAFNISKFSKGYMSPKTLKNLGLNVKLEIFEGKGNFLFHVPLGK
jgi:hypothetical protein